MPIPTRKGPIGPVAIFTTQAAAGTLPAMVAGDVATLSLSTPGVNDLDKVIAATSAALLAAGLVVINGTGFAADSLALQIVATKTFAGGTSGNIDVIIYRP